MGRKQWEFTLWRGFDPSVYWLITFVGEPKTVCLKMLDGKGTTDANCSGPKTLKHLAIVAASPGLKERGNHANLIQGKLVDESTNISLPRGCMASVRAKRSMEKVKFKAR